LVFERFTERARQAVVLAQDEARALKHNYIGTEHLLLGLLREEDGLAARVLGALGIRIQAVRDQIARMIGEGTEVFAGQIPFTPRAKKVLELSLREALALGHNYIGTEHLLLGLVREHQGVAAVVLRDLGADAATVRNEIIRMLSGPGAPGLPPEASVPRPENPAELREWPHVPSTTSMRATGWRFGLVPPLVVAAAGFPLGLLAGWAIWG
jgi:ATP-dependent Clp protease ATP-binding subunit ClpA